MAADAHGMQGAGAPGTGEGTMGGVTVQCVLAVPKTCLWTVTHVSGSGLTSKLVWNATAFTAGTVTHKAADQMW
jgi:hypothetical protein